MVTFAPAVTVWFWIALMWGAGAAVTVIVELTTATPQGLDASKLTL